MDQPQTTPAQPAPANAAGSQAGAAESAHQVPRPAQLRGAGIPRLQELSFLEVAASSASAGASFNTIRRALITHMETLRSVDAPSGNHALFQRARNLPHRYASNAAEALGELMRLGMIERRQLPSRFNEAALAPYHSHTYEMTARGQDWVRALAASRADALDELLIALWARHPQFAGYLRLLARGPFVIPTASWGELQRSHAVAEEGGREQYVAYLATRASRAVEAGVTGWTANEAEIAAAVNDYIGARIRSTERRRKPNPYVRANDFTTACEEALVSFAFGRAGVPIDYISHEILRRWTKSLRVADFSYYVPGPPALRLWASADLDEVDGLPRISRRLVAEWGDRVIDALPEAFERVRRAEPGSSWAPIYRVRAAVCAQLGLNSAVFDRALTEFVARERRPEAAFRVNLDPAQFGVTPPTEQPLRLSDRSGRRQSHHLMTIVHRSERTEP